MKGCQMTQHKDFSRDQNRNYTEHERSSAQAQDNRNPQDRYSQSQDDRYQQQSDQRYQGSQQQSGFRGGGGQQGQYGHQFSNSPSNPYANNPHGSPGMGESWGSESRYADFG